MKTNMMKMTAVAALVLGMAGVAHAAGTVAGTPGQSANITIKGAVTATTCNVEVDSANLDIGTVSVTDVAALTKGDAAGVFGKNDSATVSLTDCGTPATGNSRLIFSATPAADADQGDAHVAWGETGQSVGYGFMIHATPTGGAGAATGAALDLSWNNDTLLIDNAADTAGKLEAIKTKIEPYMIKTAGTVTPGTRLTVPMIISYSHE